MLCCTHLITARKQHHLIKQGVHASSLALCAVNETLCNRMHVMAAATVMSCSVSMWLRPQEPLVDAAAGPYSLQLVAPSPCVPHCLPMLTWGAVSYHSSPPPLLLLQQKQKWCCPGWSAAPDVVRLGASFETGSECSSKHIEMLWQETRGHETVTG